MDEDQKVDKGKFDVLLGKLLKEKPLPYEELVKEPKMRKDGKPKKSSKFVPRPDNRG
jgi:hypothetical protein